MDILDVKRKNNVLSAFR